MMVLLALIAIGMLSLSTITLRSSSQGNAMATARGNARMALMIALGEMQRYVGPDRAVTANSEILTATPGKRMTMGTWESWDYSPTSPSLNYVNQRNANFRAWLVSDMNREATRQLSYGQAGFSGQKIDIVSRNAQGGTANPVEAGIVPVFTAAGSTSRNRTGGFAWHVSDEAQKARINVYRDPNVATTLARKRAQLTGLRPEITKAGLTRNGAFPPIDTKAADFQRALEVKGKLISAAQFDMIGSAGVMRGLRNDVTPYSFGVLADVRKGGLKEDLTAIFENPNQLPGKYNTSAGNRLYLSTMGMSNPADPFWSALHSYYNVYKTISSPDANPVFAGAPVEDVTLSSTSPPTRFFPAPVISKVEMLFGFVMRDTHSNWVGSVPNAAPADPNRRFMGHLLYTPLITLHNPYNISIQFERMQVDIKNPPVGFNFFVDGQPQATQLTPLTEMFVNAPDRREKIFSLEIADWTSPASDSVNGSITLRPGQTMICSPYLHPNASFSNHQGTPFFDWQNNLTGSGRNGNTFTIKARPGFQGKGVGFDIDWLTVNHGPYRMTPPAVTSDNGLGVLGIRLDQSIAIESGILQPQLGTNDRFEITAKVTSAGNTVEYGGLQFTYGDQNTLGKFFPARFRYPVSGSIPASQCYHPNNVPISAQNLVKSFAVFSAYARTTNGGVYETNRRTPTAGALNVLRDGQLAGQPFLHHNPARPLISMDLRNQKPADQSHELNFQPIPNGEVDDLFEIDATNRTRTALGNTSTRGIKAASYLELPTGPMQSIADFRRSNALSSQFLPSFVAPIANSYASPLLATSRVVDVGANNSRLDHSVLANHALYDSYFFSTIAPYGTKTVEAVFDDFMNNRSPLLNQSYTAYLPQGKTIATARTELINGGRPNNTGSNPAFLRTAEYILCATPFNVNSTSVNAWKAVLSALSRNELLTLWSRTGALEYRDSSQTPILAMTLHNADSTSHPIVPAKVDDVMTKEWNGIREISDSQLHALAERIVAQVRLRGPFLSMSQFVNRQIGTTGANTLVGALQKAIDDSGVNNTVFAGPNIVPVTANDLSNQNLYGYATPQATLGNPAAGAPSWITQGDLMKILEPGATVRSDTFVVRSMGEAVDAAGNVIARAFAEAVVQRLPEYVDPSIRPSENVYTTTVQSSAVTTNRAFGRRIKVVSFRWLSPGEV